VSTLRVAALDVCPKLVFLVRKSQLVYPKEDVIPINLKKIVEVERGRRALDFELGARVKDKVDLFSDVQRIVIIDG
jgi:hypothetical protein